MGAAFWRAIKKAFEKVEVQRVVIVGLDDAGKTSILAKISNNTEMPIVPTIGYNLEEVTIGHVRLVVWDVGGQEKIRVLWPHYFRDCRAMVFVVDSVNAGRLSCADHTCGSCAHDELHKLLGSEDLRGSAFLIYANKQDLPNALSLEEVRARLEIASFPDRAIRVQASSAVTGEGLMAGLEWMVEQVSKKAR